MGKQIVTFWITVVVIIFAGGFPGKAGEPKSAAEDTISGLLVPVSDAELTEKVTEALKAVGHDPTSIQVVSLGDLGRVYVATAGEGHEKVFARVVARRVPCMDCHDVFFVYSFDHRMTFLDFIPIYVTKRYNKPWNSDDVTKIRNRFSEQSLSEDIPFNPMVDAVSSATISSKLVFHSINQTDQVLKQLVELGHMAD